MILVYVSNSSIEYKNDLLKGMVLLYFFQGKLMFFIDFMHDFNEDFFRELYQHIML